MELRYFGKNNLQQESLVGLGSYAARTSIQCVNESWLSLCHPGFLLGVVETPLKIQVTYSSDRCFRYRGWGNGLVVERNLSATALSGDRIEEQK